MHVSRLAHVAIGGSEAAGLQEFYEEIFGLVEVERRGDLTFLATGTGCGYDVVLGPWPAGMDHFALELADMASLAEARRRLAEAGAAALPLEAASEYRILDGVRTVLPSGHVVELVVPLETEVYSPRPTIDPRHHRGIGPVLLEHVTMICGNVRRTSEFLTDVVGLRLTESVRPEADVWFNAFLRCRDRHHDVAFFENPDGDVPRLNHFCFAVPSVHEILRVSDLLAARGVQLDSSMGRHISGNNVFIYFKDPSGNRIEVNTDMAVIDASASARIMKDSIFDAWRVGIPPAMLPSSRCRDGRGIRVEAG